MAATTTPPSGPRPAEIVPEHDKLGPMAPPSSAMPSFSDGAAVRAHLIAVVRDALEPARTARARAGAQPQSAVHVVRKAIRRTRALLDLVASALPKSERKDIRKALVLARRSLGPARDLRVASDALTALAGPGELAPAAAAIVAAAHSDAPSADAVADDLGRAVDVALAQADAIAAALPDEVRARDLLRGLTATYRRARQARRKARRSERAVHRWRRRNKELVYQLAVIAEVPAAAELREAMSELDHELGGVVDRLLLTDFIGLYSHAADPEHAAALLTQVHDDLIDRRDQARKRSKDLFAVRPRKLRRRLKRALSPVVEAPVEAGASDAAAAPAPAPASA